MLHRITLAAATALLLTHGAMAQDDTLDARIAVAQSYIDMTLDEMTPEGMADAAAGPVIRQLRLTSPSITEDQVNRIELMIGTEMAQINRDVVSQTAGDLAAVMTLEELTALRDFYASEVGRAVMTKMPDYLRSYQPQVMEAMNGRYNQINAAIITILNEE